MTHKALLSGTVLLFALPLFLMFPLLAGSITWLAFEYFKIPHAIEVALAIAGLTLLAQNRFLARSPAV